MTVLAALHARFSFWKPNLAPAALHFWAGPPDTNSLSGKRTSRSQNINFLNQL